MPRQGRRRSRGIQIESSVWLREWLVTVPTDTPGWPIPRVGMKGAGTRFGSTLLRPFLLRDGAGRAFEREVRLATKRLCRSVRILV